MRIQVITRAALALVLVLVARAGCSGELAGRAPANDPTSAAAAESPFHRPPSAEADPLLATPRPTEKAPAPGGR